MSNKDIYFLLHLAKKTRIHNILESSTGELAAELSVSQQTVSRKLQEFAMEGLIVRQATPSGVTVRFAEKGKEKLRKLHGELQHLFGHQLSMKGVLKDGLGEGRFYMSQKMYKKQFQDILGFSPYHGTLNLTVDKLC